MKPQCIENLPRDSQICSHLMALFWSDLESQASRGSQPGLENRKIDNFLIKSRNT